LTDARPAWELAADTNLFNLQRLQNRFSAPLDIFTLYTVLRFAHGFQPCLIIRLYKNVKVRTEVIQNHENEDVRGIGQGEAKPRK
jgi:hypothetical protein